MDFLVAVISKNPSLHDNIRSEFVNKDKSFLFLGFGFQNWYLRIMIHVLFGNDRERHSYALQHLDSTVPQDFQQTIIFFEQKYKIHIYTEDLNQFVKELKNRYEDIGKVASIKIQSKIEIYQDAPTVFLCYANENKSVAEYFYGILHDKGIKPWIDKENIYQFKKERYK